MTDERASRLMAALAQPIRLRFVLALSSADERGMASSDLADLVGVPRNLASSHLAVLLKAGAVSSVKDGRSVRYKVDGDAVLDLSRFVASIITSPDANSAGSVRS